MGGWSPAFPTDCGAASMPCAGPSDGRIESSLVRPDSIGEGSTSGMWSVRAIGRFPDSRPCRARRDTVTGPEPCIGASPDCCCTTQGRPRHRRRSRSDEQHGLAQVSAAAREIALPIRESPVPFIFREDLRKARDTLGRDRGECFGSGRFPNTRTTIATA